MTTRELSNPPRLLPLYARTLAPLLPGATLLPFLGARGGDLPDLELTLAQLRVDPDHLAAYAHVCGFSLRDALPATYPHVLAFGLHLALMADRDFPFPAVGLVHVANRIVQHRPIELGEALDLRVRTTPPQAHPRGRTFALVSEIHIDGKLVWEDHSTMLRRGAGKGEDGDARDASGTVRAQAAKPGVVGPGDTGPGDTGPRAPGPHGTGPGDTGGTGPGDTGGTGPGDTGGTAGRAQRPPQSALWRLPGDLGRRYAGVSADRNPIHMHALSAKAFGFPRAIAHGMWTKARCLAALERRLPDGFAVDVDFRRPILLPGEVAFGSEDLTGGAIGFAVWAADGGTRHLDGRLAPSAGVDALVGGDLVDTNAVPAARAYASARTRGGDQKTKADTDT